ncbi:MAG: hypothetical protein DRO09_02325 [Thermoprotei archaeon]|nr:MAG: hypothetical protein DRO09_02325 [Thermoprotei archaeon]
MNALQIAFISNSPFKDVEVHELVSYIAARHAPTCLITGGDLLIDPAKAVKDVHLLVVSGDMDDVYLTKSARSVNVLLDGRVVNINGFNVAGIGGLEPSQNIRRVVNLVERLKAHVDILVTHFPPRGCLDSVNELGVRRGLLEVSDVCRLLNPSLVLTAHSRRAGVCVLSQGVRVISAGFADELRYVLVKVIRLGKAVSIYARFLKKN